MDYVALKTEVQTDPASLGYGALLPDCPGLVVNLLNGISPTVKCLKPRFVTARTILKECAGGGTLLDALERAVVGAPVAPVNTELQSSIKWALKFLGQDSGLDVGTTSTQTLIGYCVATGVLTQAQGDSLVAMGMQLCSRAEQLGFGNVSEADLRIAGVIT
jgi:hypothetical protein